MIPETPKEAALFEQDWDQIGVARDLEVEYIQVEPERHQQCWMEHWWEAAPWAPKEVVGLVDWWKVVQTE